MLNFEKIKKTMESDGFSIKELDKNRFLVKDVYENTLEIKTKIDILNYVLEEIKIPGLSNPINDSKDIKKIENDIKKIKKMIKKGEGNEFKFLCNIRNEIYKRKWNFTKRRENN